MSDPATSDSGFSTGAQPTTQPAEAPEPTASQDDDRIHPAERYAGDISPALAWRWARDGIAVIVDVRTDAEREWVGFVPGAVALAWKQWPQMQRDPAFEAGLQRLDDRTPVLMLCRSGVRSVAAAQAATAIGRQAYNILEGFEGDRDPQGHRGKTNGWQFRGLPWRQN